MRSFIFTKRDRQVLESVLDGTYDKSNPKDNMLLSVLKKRVIEYKDALWQDMELMEKIIEKLDLKP